jgi:BirA family transcriptional regulator, biotin operon repressor / biotin---[acetyl-CoA-carboxylase] ligase
MRVAEAFDPELFSALLLEAGLRWGRPLHFASVTGSTNDDALRAAKSGEAHGALFVADHQSQGRGRSGHAWQSPPAENLLFSLLLRPDLNAWPGAALTLSVGLAVRAALAAESGAPLSVKWPNDVLAGERKLAGILCEGQLSPSGKLDALVIGVGINVYGTHFAGELGQIATSLQLTRAGGLGRPPLPRREQLLTHVLQEMEHQIERTLARGFAELSAEFAAHDALKDQHVVVSGARSLRGIARGVDREGRLIIETAQGLEWVGAGTVRIAAGGS